MTISDLPMDLQREILYRVPMKYVRAMQLTCKTWDTLLKKRVREMQEGESRMVALMNYNLHLINVVVDDVEHPTTEIIGKRSCLDRQQIKIIKVFNYEGLLLCVLDNSFRLMVWNPYLGQTKWIEPPSYSFRLELDGYDRYTYALGYDQKKKSHKVLRFMDSGILYLLETGHFFCYEIFDFDSNSWRTLDVGDPHWSITFYMTGVPLRGNTYWLAKDRISNYEGSDRLVCFDFTSERFGPTLPLPFSFEETQHRDVEVHLSCLKGDKLAVLYQLDRPMKVEIWVTSVIEPTKVSWTKFLTVNTGPVVTTTPRIEFTSMGFFIDEEKKVAMVFDKHRSIRHTLNIIGEAGFFREVDFPVCRVRRKSADYTPVCSHYIPSLVQIQNQKPTLIVSKRRKQRSKFQLCPCDQNKLILDHDEERSAKRTRRR